MTHYRASKEHSSVSDWRIQAGETRQDSTSHDIPSDSKWATPMARGQERRIITVMRLRCRKGAKIWGKAKSQTSRIWTPWWAVQAGAHLQWQPGYQPLVLPVSVQNTEQEGAQQDHQENADLGKQKSTRCGSQLSWALHGWKESHNCVAWCEHQSSISTLCLFQLFSSLAGHPFSAAVITNLYLLFDFFCFKRKYKLRSQIHECKITGLSGNQMHRNSWTVEFTSYPNPNFTNDLKGHKQS